jgi:hypothetical protein
LADPSRILETCWSFGKARAGFKKIRQKKLTGKLAFCFFVTLQPFEDLSKSPLPTAGRLQKKGGDCFIPDGRFAF